MWIALPVVLTEIFVKLSPKLVGLPLPCLWFCSWSQLSFMIKNLTCIKANSLCLDSRLWTVFAFTCVDYKNKFTLLLLQLEKESNPSKQHTQRKISCPNFQILSFSLYIKVLQQIMILFTYTRQFETGLLIQTILKVAFWMMYDTVWIH